MMSRGPLADLLILKRPRFCCGCRMRLSRGQCVKRHFGRIVLCLECERRRPRG